MPAQSGRGARVADASTGTAGLDYFAACTGQVAQKNSVHGPLGSGTWLAPVDQASTYLVIGRAFRHSGSGKPNPTAHQRDRGTTARTAPPRARLRSHSCACGVTALAHPQARPQAGPRLPNIDQVTNAHAQHCRRDGAMACGSFGQPGLHNVAMLCCARQTVGAERSPRQAVMRGWTEGCVI